MSEHRCRLGHLMKSGDLVCPTCGTRVHTVDGMTERELKAEDRAEMARDGEDEGGGGE